MNKQIKFIVAVAASISLLAVSQFYYFRLDLTSEKRNTLNDATIEVIEGLNKPLVLEVFLTGDLPPAFQGLRKSLADMLDEYQSYSGNTIIVKWTDPYEGSSEKQIKARFQKIVDAGLRPYTLQERSADGKTSKRAVIAGALLSNGKVNVPINFLQTKDGQPLESNILLSEQLLEYECTAAITKLTENSRKKIAIITGQGAPSAKYTESAARNIAQFYPLAYLTVAEAAADTTVGMMLFTKPQKEFTELDKYYVDRFVQSGRNVLWYLDASLVSMDSLAYVPTTLALANNTNIDDLLFKYGVRINYSLIMDNQCAMIPVNVAPAGEKPQYNPAPWFYSPLLTPSEQHPVSARINVVRGDFVSVLDTVGDPAISKTILLTSSSYSRVVTLPAPIGFDILDKAPDERFFNRYKQIAAVLHEGTFAPLYKNRQLPAGAQTLDYLPTGKPAKQIFVADGDAVLNIVRAVGRDSMAMPLGQDRYTKQTYGNLEFLLNAVNYLNGDERLLALRGRELKLRMLERTRIVAERKMWQMINVAGPLALLIAGGLTFYFVRRRRFTK